MLDSYIIEQIKRERERSDSAYVPLHVELPVPPPEYHDRKESSQDNEEETPRGVIIIDYNVEGIEIGGDGN